MEFPSLAVRRYTCDPTPLHLAASFRSRSPGRTGRCFADAEIEDEARRAAIAQTEVCRRWWQSLAQLRATNPDSSPVATPLPEVFRLE